jgi:hypothetical protein
LLIWSPVLSIDQSAQFLTLGIFHTSNFKYEHFV